MRVLFVGMNPGSSESPTVKSNSALGRLFKWADALGVDYFSFVNCASYVGDFDHRRSDVVFLRAVLESHRGPVVALGNGPQHVLRKMDVRHMGVPHPSYRNRKFNDPSAEAAVLAAIGRYIERGDWS